MRTPAALWPSSLPAWTAAGCERLIAVLSDPARRMRAALGLALAYALLWALYATIAKSSQAINADMGEMLVWMREPALGYPKHPPFLVCELWLWFAVFPLADWSYYLLAGVNLGAGLFACFLLAGEWLEGEKRALVPFLLGLIPFYNFLGLKFDQNSALIPLWALATFAFVRSLERRTPGYAALAGLLAAACLLSKYWSVFLLLALGIASLCQPRRRAYFRSWAPYVTALVAAAACAPHAYWLIREHFPPLQWVTERRLALSGFDALRSTAEYVFGTLGYASIAVAVALAVVRPPWSGVRDGLFPRDPDRRTAALVFWLPMLLPVATALITGTALLSLWNTPALNLLPVVLLGSPRVTVMPRQAARIAAVALALWIAALLVSPLVAFLAFRNGVENYALYVRPLAAALDNAWRRDVHAPLKLVAGHPEIVNSVVMYMADRPSGFPNLYEYLAPWATEERIRRDGMIVVFPKAPVHEDLMTRLGETVPGAVRLPDIELRPTWLWFQGPPRRFMVDIVPPNSGGAPAAAARAPLPLAILLCSRCHAKQ